MAKRTKEQTMKILKKLFVALYEKGVTTPEILKELGAAKTIVRKKKRLLEKGFEHVNQDQQA